MCRFSSVHERRVPVQPHFRSCTPFKIETTETHVVAVVFIVSSSAFGSEEAAAVNESFLRAFPLFRDHSPIGGEERGARASPPSKATQSQGGFSEDRQASFRR